ncbi:MAG: ROK family protein [Sedimentisphaerales bacterium]|nr:ROK family protein [Sedimentisphaerales bacterium]
MGNSLRTLQLLDRKGPLAKKQVAQTLGVTKPAALDHFRILSRENLVIPVDRKFMPGPGRPLELWDINRQDNYTIGIVIEPPLLVAGLSNFSDKLRMRCEHDISSLKATEDILPLIDEFMIGAIEYIKSHNGKLRGVWLCSAGPAHMPSQNRVDFHQYLAQNYDLPVNVSALDVAAAFGEAARFERNTIVGVIVWDMGIAIIPCQDHRVLNFHELAPAKKLGLHDIAHVIIDRRGPKCICGHNGCLEAYTGGRAIIKQIDRPDVNTLKDLIKLAQNGDEHTLTVLRDAARILGDFVASNVQIMGIEKLICTGLLSRVFPMVRDAFCQGLDRCLSPEQIQSLEIAPSDGPLDGTLLGACRVARQVFISNGNYTAVS